MGYKALAVKIIMALGIPLFPLGARLYLAQSGAPDIQEAARAGLKETPAAEPEGFGEAFRFGEMERVNEPEGFIDEALPPVGPETLARAFRPPGTGAAGERPPEAEAGVRDRPVPGEGKFSYLGSIRKSDDQEWLYIKEEATGRILSVNALTSSIDEERCVVEIGGIVYFIRRN